MPVDCPALAKGLAGGKGKKASVCVQGGGLGEKGWEDHFLYDAVDFCNVFLVYLHFETHRSSKISTFGLVLFCHFFLQTFFPTSVAVRSLEIERTHKGSGLLVPDCTPMGKVKEMYPKPFHPFALYIQPHISCLQRVSPDPKQARP